MRRKFLALFLAMTLAMGGLTACGEESENGVTPNGESQGEEEEDD